MDALLRLLLRFILVPLGYLAAVIVGACVILLGSWRFAEMLVSQNPDVFADRRARLRARGPGAVRHAVLGHVAARRGRHFDLGSVRDPLLDLPCAQRRDLGLGRLADVRGVRSVGEPLNATQFVFGAGLAGGFAYWAVAGWSAGFWKPVFRQRTLPPPPVDRLNPPARTEAGR